MGKASSRGADVLVPAKEWLAETADEDVPAPLSALLN
jgi:hypothetical protein